ncbi:MAG: hypothetical protein AAGF24_06840 [Cyanobacteria bacterium P01_H01_bin.121]
MEIKINTLINLRELARRGTTADERDTAARMLKRFCELAGINEDEVEALNRDVNRGWHDFIYNDDYQLQILCQIALKLFGKGLKYANDSKRNSKRKRKIASLYLSEVDHVTLQMWFEHYREEWDRLLNQMHTAFLLRNDILRSAEPHEIPDEVTEEDLAKWEEINRLSKAMKKTGTPSSRLPERASSTTQKVRNIVRIEAFGDKNLTVIVAGWDPDTKVILPIATVQQSLPDFTPFEGMRLIAKVNSGALRSEDLEFSDFELPDIAEADTYPA